MTVPRESIRCAIAARGESLAAGIRVPDGGQVSTVVVERAERFFGA